MYKHTRKDKHGNDNNFKDTTGRKEVLLVDRIDRDSIWKPPPLILRVYKFGQLDLPLQGQGFPLFCPRLTREAKIQSYFRLYKKNSNNQKTVHIAFVQIFCRSCSAAGFQRVAAANVHYRYSISFLYKEAAETAAAAAEAAIAAELKTPSWH